MNRDPSHDVPDTGSPMPEQREELDAQGGTAGVEVEATALHADAVSEPAPAKPEPPPGESEPRPPAVAVAAGVPPLTARARFDAAAWGLAFRSISALALVGFSIALYVQQLFGNWVDKFVESNELDPGARKALLVTLLIGAAVSGFLPSAYLLWKRSVRAAEQLRTVAHLLSPLVLLGAVPAIFRWKPWIKDSLGLGIAILVLVVVLENTSRMSLEAVPERVWSWLLARKRWLTTRFPRATRYAPFVLVMLGAVAYAVFMSTMAVRLHHRLATRAFDLGGYDNLFYNALSGHPMRCPANVMPTGDWSSLKGHAELSIYVLLPIYAIVPRAETLLVLQSTLLGLGAIPVYLLGARRLPRLLAMVVAFVYLLFPAMHAANLFDVHMQPMAVFFVLWTAYFFDARRNVLLAIFLVIALGCREDISIGIVVAALFSAFCGVRPLAATLVVAVSALYFVGMRFIIMPMIGPWWFQGIYKDLFPAGEQTYGGVLKTLLTNPVFVFGTLLTEEKLVHVLRVLAPVAFLPLRKYWLWVLLVPGAFFTVLTTGYPPTVSPSFQYVGHWIPYVFIALVIALSVLRSEHQRFRRASIAVSLIVASLAGSYNWGALMQRNYMVSGWGKVNLEPLTEQERTELAQLRELIAMIPRDASVSASETELPHVSNRLNAHTLRYTYDKDDYILYRASSGKFGADNAKKAIQSGSYEETAARGPFRLLKRKPDAS